MVAQPQITRRQVLHAGIRVAGVAALTAVLAARTPRDGEASVRAQAPVGTAPVPPPPPVSPVADVWVAAGAMVQPRVEHRLTRLRDGRVLVTGGNDGTGPLATAEVYDPGTNGWAAAAPMTTAREGHTATLLDNGDVLVVGGFGTQRPISLATAERYDVVADRWTPVAPMVSERSGHTAVAFTDADARAGVLLVGGGTAREQRTAERYDVAGDAWSAVGDLREYHLRSVLEATPSGEIICIGSSATVVAEHYDRRAERWMASAPLSLGGPRRGQGRGALLRGTGQIVLTGGIAYAYVPVPQAIAACYDPATQAWTALPPMTTARTAHTVSWLGDDRILVAGGTGGRSSSPAMLNATLDTAEIYAPRTNDWTPAAVLRDPRRGHEAVELANGGVLVVGGYDIRRAALATAERYGG